jgi:hypothetical protein
LTVFEKGQPRSLAPISPAEKPVDEVDQRVLAFISHDAVDFWEMLQDLVVAQAREMPANGKVRGDAPRAQMLGNFSKLGQENLKDQREADHQRLPRHEPLCDVFWSIANIDHVDGVSPLLKHGRQISHPEIALILIPDQGYLRTRR